MALTAGCSVRQFGSKVEILRAAHDLAAAGRAGFTLTAGGRVEDLIAVAEKEAAAGGYTFTAEDAGALRRVYDSSLTIAWDRAGSGVADDRYLAKAVVGGVDGTQVRVVDEVTYARVPFAKLAARFGGSKDDLDQIRQDLGPATAGVDTLIGGGWVRVGAADMEKFAETVGAAAPAPDPELSEEYGTELVTSVVNLAESAAVTQDPKDETHLIVTTSTVKVYEEGIRLIEAVQKLADEPTAELLDETLDSGLGEAPADRPIVVDLWIDNGRFQALEFNLLQFVKGSTGRAGLRVEFTRGRNITAPGHADELDLSRIFESITEGPAGSGSPVRSGSRRGGPGS
jgi:hypothetical protein